MLALPRIAAVHDGTVSSQRTRRTGKPADVTNNPFIKMLAGLPGTQSAPGAGSSAPSPDKAAKKANAPSGKPAVNISYSGLQGDKAARLAKSGAHKTGKAEAKAGEATAAAVTAVKMPAGQADAAAIQTAAAEKNNEKPRRLSDPSSDDAGAAMAAAMGARAIAKPEQLGLKTVADGAGRRDGERSGIENLGTHTETGKNGAKLSVVDLRLKATKQGRDGSEPKGEPAKSGSEGKSEGLDATAPNAGDRLAAAPEARQASAPEAAAKNGPAASGSFAESLAARLREGAADIVRSAQVVLRNGDSGLIRMRLEPESLGGVKIELRMAEKQISGKIIVESDIAGEAFRSSIDALRDAFAESGFETTSLEVEVRNGMAAGAQGDGRGDGRGGDGAGSEGPYWSRSLRELDAAVPSAAIMSGSRSGSLDMIV